MLDLQYRLGRLLEFHGVEPRNSPVLSDRHEPACSFFHLNYLDWLAGLGVLVPLSFCTAVGICVGCVSGCGIVGSKDTYSFSALDTYCQLSCRKPGLHHPPGSGLPVGQFPCLLTSKGQCACGFIFSFSPRILCFLSQRIGGNQGSSLGPQGSLLPTLFSASAVPT